MYFDAHSDIFTDITKKSMLGEYDAFKKYHWGDYIKSGITGSIFVMWIDNGYFNCPEKRIKEIREAAKIFFVRNKDIVKQVLNYEDFEVANREKRLGIMVGSEGLSHIGKELGQIENLYKEIGLRHISLTWNEENDLATGVGGNSERGITNLGKEAVNIIQNLGIVLDVSHLNDKSFWDVMAVTKAPIIASHSNSRELCNNRRNLTDEQIKAIAATGGVIGMNCYHEFISTDITKKNCKGLVEHVDRVVELVGVDHVGCGFDFVDYISSTGINSADENNKPYVEDLYTVSQAMNFVEELKNRGYKLEDIQKIKSDNFMRVIKNVLN